MKLAKVKDVFKDWVKAGYRFGYGFSNLVADKLEMSYGTRKYAGGAFDLTAGAGLVYLAASSMLVTTLGMVGAAASITAAPAAAVLTLAVGPVWLALSTITCGIGFGLLGACKEKFNLPGPSSFLHGARAALDETAASVKGIFKPGAKKTSADFKIAADGKAQSPDRKKQAPHQGNDFRL